VCYTCGCKLPYEDHGEAAPVLEDARLYRVGAALEGAIGPVLSIDKLEVAR
jgi:hypothetical protein